MVGVVVVAVVFGWLVWCCGCVVGGVGGLLCLGGWCGVVVGVVVVVGWLVWCCGCVVGVVGVVVVLGWLV